MAKFKNNKISATVFQQAESITTNGPLVAQHQTNVTAIETQLAELLDEIGREALAGRVDKQTAEQLRRQVDEAAKEAATPEPRRSRLIAALERAKELVNGIAGASALAQSVEKLLKALSSSS